MTAKNTSKPFSTLIHPVELAEILESEHLLIFDASIPPVGAMNVPDACWPIVSIPDAQFFDIEGDFSDNSGQFPHTLPTVEQFEKNARALGVNQNSQVVVYDHYGIFSSARAWWLFKAMGHHNVAVLDGGLPAWLAKKLPTVKGDEAPSNLAGNFKAQYNESYFCDYHYVLDNIENAQSKCLDARANNRFLAQAPEPRVGVRSGHIPNSQNLPFTTLQHQGALLPAEQLKQKFSQLALPSEQLVMSCGSGITACILALAAEIAGYNDIRVYDGSWSEWGSLNELPISTSE